MSDKRPTAALRLSCQPSKAGNKLVFPYRLENEGPGDVYAMHAMPAPAAAADEAAAVIIGAANGEAIIGKFVPPLPMDRRIAVPLIPLARHLPAGEFVEGRIEVRLPLAETSPYFPDLTLREYELVDIAGVVLTVACWLADPGEVIAKPFAAAAELVTLHPSSPATSARLATQRFPTRGLQLFRRTDQFPRQVG